LQLLVAHLEQGHTRAPPLELGFQPGQRRRDCEPRSVGLRDVILVSWGRAVDCLDCSHCRILGSNCYPYWMGTFKCIDSLTGAIYEIVMMTSWLPDLSQGSGPLYMRLAERIEESIADGTLPAGAKLPPQRDLAYDIGVTIGTVGRAYALIRERGLVSGEVGRGTFVLGRDGHHDIVPAHVSPIETRSPAERGKLRMDSTSAPAVGQSDVIERLTSQIVRTRPEQVTDYARIW